jgi:hypothetical protein
MVPVNMTCLKDALVDTEFWSEKEKISLRHKCYINSDIVFKFKSIKPDAF